MKSLSQQIDQCPAVYFSLKKEFLLLDPLDLAKPLKDDQTGDVAILVNIEIANFDWHNEFNGQNTWGLLSLDDTVVLIDIP